MSDNKYIQKRRRVRNKPLITTRNILMLILLSVAVYAGFYFEYGVIDDGTCKDVCENEYSFWAWVIGFFFIFAAIIAAGALGGGVLAFLRWSRGRKDDTLSTFLNSSSDDQKN